MDRGASGGKDDRPRLGWGRLARNREDGSKAMAGDMDKLCFFFWQPK